MAEIEARDSDTVEAEAGDEIVIRLPENGTTGYVWSVATSSGGVEVVSDTFTPLSDGIGAGGHRVIRLRALAAGRAEVTLRLARSWEDNPADERRLAVVVR